ncbi:MAG: rRNA maturation RNase YbeY [Kordiimonadaceae bacterium]|jgi:probable rRNA maturation factor|nr:rRNA maturation RNase YbeY [Kordiimonadaceae bacterium]MBT6036647.1 rRNA maturation RNase YbeY [Kordiimonadaceae bacterium]MBT6329545.1 rRNA maturation RNase YbeY [Kordiimonadaceae bacterium]MBT7583825.1 rRNA maturation RNase YbeY [Kordiimonadaceae bacterium]
MALPDGLLLEISIDFESWQETLLNYQELATKAIEQITKNVNEGKALQNFSHLELSIVLCDDALIHKLNNDYRMQNKPTNVLSFPGLTAEQIDEYLIGGKGPPEGPYSLGEIYIAYETIVQEAQVSDIKVENHFTHLIIHGVLHLLGFDHVEDAQADEMERIETKLLGYLGVDDPYAA